METHHDYEIALALQRAGDDGIPQFSVLRPPQTTGASSNHGAHHLVPQRQYNSHAQPSGPARLPERHNRTGSDRTGQQNRGAHRSESAAQLYIPIGVAQYAPQHTPLASGAPAAAAGGVAVPPVHFAVPSGGSQSAALQSQPQPQPQPERSGLALNPVEEWDAVPPPPFVPPYQPRTLPGGAQQSYQPVGHFTSNASQEMPRPPYVSPPPQQQHTPQAPPANFHPLQQNYPTPQWGGYSQSFPYPPPQVPPVQPNSTGGWTGSDFPQSGVPPAHAPQQIPPQPHSRPPPPQPTPQHSPPQLLAVSPTSAGQGGPTGTPAHQREGEGLSAGRQNLWATPQQQPQQQPLRYNFQPPPNHNATIPSSPPSRGDDSSQRAGTNMWAQQQPAFPLPPTNPVNVGRPALGSEAGVAQRETSIENYSWGGPGGAAVSEENSNAQGGTTNNSNSGSNANNEPQIHPWGAAPSHGRPWGSSGSGSREDRSSGHRHGGYGGHSGPAHHNRQHRDNNRNPHISRVFNGHAPRRSGYQPSYGDRQSNTPPQYPPFENIAPFIQRYGGDDNSTQQGGGAAASSAPASSDGSPFHVSPSGSGSPSIAMWGMGSAVDDPPQATGMNVWATAQAGVWPPTGVPSLAVPAMGGASSAAADGPVDEDQLVRQEQERADHEMARRLQEEEDNDQLQTHQLLEGRLRAERQQLANQFAEQLRRANEEQQRQRRVRDMRDEQPAYDSDDSDEYPNPFGHPPRQLDEDEPAHHLPWRTGRVAYGGLGAAAASLNLGVPGRGGPPPQPGRFRGHFNYGGGGYEGLMRLHGMHGMRRRNQYEMDLNGMSYEELLAFCEENKVRVGVDANTLDVTTHCSALTEEEINGLKERDDAVCAICQDDYEAGMMARRLPCMHLFHQECIDTWFKDNKTCPICKKAVDEHLRDD